MEQYHGQVLSIAAEQGYKDTVCVLAGMSMSARYTNTATLEWHNYVYGIEIALNESVGYSNIPSSPLRHAYELRKKKQG